MITDTVFWHQWITEGGSEIKAGHYWSLSCFRLLCLVQLEDLYSSTMKFIFERSHCSFNAYSKVRRRGSSVSKSADRFHWNELIPSRNGHSMSVCFPGSLSRTFQARWLLLLFAVYQRSNLLCDDPKRWHKIAVFMCVIAFTLVVSVFVLPPPPPGPPVIVPSFTMCVYCESVSRTSCWS